jgi:hypothetical protein
MALFAEVATRRPHGGDVPMFSVGVPAQKRLRGGNLSGGPLRWVSDLAACSRTSKKAPTAVCSREKRLANEHVERRRKGDTHVVCQLKVIGLEMQPSTVATALVSDSNN